MSDINFDGVLDATRYVLKTYPDSRNNDGILISKVMEYMNPSIRGFKFNFVLENRKALGLPSFETITRARRKIQASDKNLKGDKEVEEAIDNPSVTTKEAKGSEIDVNVPKKEIILPVSSTLFP